MTKPHPRPSENTLSITREPVSGDCPACGAESLQRYPVLGEDGWTDIVRCADCLHSVSRDEGPKLGAIELLSDLI